MTGIEISDHDQFDRLLERLARDVVDAEIFRRLHSDLSASRTEFVREFAQSRTFWYLTFEALIEAVLFRLIRAYDSDRRALSLQSWLETIKHNLHMFGAQSSTPSSEVSGRSSIAPDPKQLECDLSSVSTGDPLVKKLIQLRGHFIAHINANNIVHEKQLEKRFGLTYDEIGLLVDRATTIVNRYSVLFKRTSWSTVIVGHDDFMTVLKALRTDLERRKAEIAAEIELLDKGNL